ncbi:FAD:protein FMN transferase [Pseudoalteromonas peptidolytica]|uniref:FAD:protein FMN transferase n=1 Tax=Pseudoalteromonas peptidolytica TaxID=61150 RepID=UPI00298D8F19|nr:FAD:protein FMN transferase [Pseudoalteromonas peptidolytica]MDW7547567.1 FAD:protein FMN transferase [Pseudoalteromonas peptidolytica]
MKISGNLISKIFIVSFFFFFLSACQEKQQPPTEIVLSGKTMGTTYNIKVFPGQNSLSQAQLHDEVEQALKAVNQSMSTYIPDSEINQFNALPANTVMPISEDFRTVIEESIRLGQSTETLDVTMGPLIDLWGFGPDKRPTKRPSQLALDDMRSRIGIDKLALTDAGLAKTIPGLELSFSATAKGYGIDKVATVIESHDIHDYMVEIGGELRVSGKKPDGNWRIAIEKPDAPVGQRQIHRVIEPGKNGIATSGDYRIFYEMDGETFTHLIDSMTGRPVKHELVSVTVLHPSAMVADGLATALTVMGTERAKAYAQQHQLPVYLMYKSAEGIKTYASDEFKPYLN